MITRPRLQPDQKGVVLVVEDEPFIRRYATNFLVEAGYTAIEADSSSQALTILEGYVDIHVVFTDIEMPGQMNGLDLAAGIRQRWPEIAVLVTSGRLHPSADELPGGVDFIAKPYRSECVITKVEALLLARWSSAARRRST